MADNKPSFFKSVASGISGYFTGLLSGAAIGAISGAAVNLLFGLATGGILTSAAAGAALLSGAGAGAVLFAGVGALAGTITGVVRSREAAQVNDQDVVNVANMAFAQGVSVGHDMTVTNPALAEQESKKFRAMVEEQRAVHATTQQR